ncbi:MAG: hypothetical protein WAP35_11085 [Solirubrobacterales bacterium]
MRNHFHLVLSQGPAPFMISQIMRRVVGPYALKFNAKHGRTGQLWDGPFRARKIDGPIDLLETIAYVNLNPAEQDRPDDCSHPYYLGSSPPPPWLSIDRALAAFSGHVGYSEFTADRERIRSARRRAQGLEWQ